MKIQQFIEELEKQAEERFENFKIEEHDTISTIKSDAYLEKPTWVGGDTQFVCLFIDLNRSSKLSFEKHPKTMAKIYDYFTQSIVDVFSNSSFSAEYIDVKGDGAFAIFEGKYASYRAFYAAITFRVLFETAIKKKSEFTDSENNHLSCKIGIHKDKILVKKIGKRGDYNEVWAGRLVNNAAKLSQEYENNPDNFFKPNPPHNRLSSPIIISEQVYADFIRQPECGLYRCHDLTNDQDISDQKIPVFSEIPDFTDETLGDKLYYTCVNWCPYCADKYIDRVSSE